MFLGVEKENSHSLFVGRLGSAERRGVVAANFPLTGAKRGCTIHVTVDDKRRSAEACGEVRTNRRYYDAELKLLCRADAYLGCCAEEDRADVKRCACLVRRQVVDVLTHSEFTRFDEEVSGNLCHIHRFG